MRDGCGVGIVGLGACLPDQVRANSWWPAAWHAALPDGRQSDIVGMAERAGAAEDDGFARAVARWAGDPFRGARERRVIADDEESSDLEIRACQAALTHADRTAADIDLLIGYSQVPDDAGPANHGIVAGGLGLSGDLCAMTLEAGCASFLPQLTTAIRLIQVEDHRCGLLYQSSAISRVTDYTTPVSANVGDGAVAQVVGPVGSGLGLIARAQRTYPELRGGLVLQPSDGRPRWYEPGAPELVVGVRDPAAAQRMGARAPAYAREVCLEVLERADATVDQVDFFVCAQATAWYTEACASAIGIPSSRWIPVGDHYQRYGHLLAGSAPLNLYVAWRSGRLRPGSVVLIYSPGVGFTTTAALLRWALPPA